MDEEKKIMEKRSSFRGWKERNKGKTNERRKAIVLIFAISILLVLAWYPYLSKTDDNNNGNDSSSGKNDTKNETKNETVPIIKNTNSSQNISKNISTIKRTPTVNVTATPKRIIVGKLGVPLVSSGFEITIKSITVTDIRSSVWIIVRNIENGEKPFKIGPGTIIIDNVGQQYENIKVARSAEIAQTNLSAKAMREGAIFFETIKEGRTAKNLTLNINNDKVEFILGNKS